MTATCYVGGQCWAVLDDRIRSADDFRAALGLIPDFIVAGDPRPAREQLDERYAHGGGWRPVAEFSVDRATLVIQYPGDPPLSPYACTRTASGDLVAVYPHAWVLVLSGDSEVARLD